MDIKREFGYFDQYPGYRYMDSASTSLIPKIVVEEYAKALNLATNIDSIYPSSKQASIYWSDLKENLCNFFADLYLSPNQIALLPSASYASNAVIMGIKNELVNLSSQSPIPMVFLVSSTDHYSGIAPILRLAKDCNAIVEYMPLTPFGTWDLDLLKSKEYLDQITLVSVSHASNVIGVIEPVDQLISLIKKHSNDCITIVDMCQSAQLVSRHKDCKNIDYCIFSSHKLYGPIGIAALVSPTNSLDRLEAYMVGGKMLESLSVTSITTTSSPGHLEMGSPNVVAAHAWSVALDWYRNQTTSITDLNTHLFDQLSRVAGWKVLGGAYPDRVLVSGYSPSVDSYDITSLLAANKVCVRGGSLCSALFQSSFGIKGGVVRFSPGIFCTQEDIEYSANQLQIILDQLGSN